MPGEERWHVHTGRSSYTFTARVKRLEHWVVNADSIQRTIDGTSAAPDAQDLIAELAPVLEIPDALLPTYLEEIASTLASTAWKLHHRRVPVADLVDAELEPYVLDEEGFRPGVMGASLNPVVSSCTWRLRQISLE